MKGLLIILFILLSYNSKAQIDSVLSIQKINNELGGLTGSPIGNGGRFGSATAVIGDVDHDGIDDIAVGEYLDDDGSANKGAVFILMLNADGTVKAQQKISVLEGNAPAFETGHYYFGSSLAAIGDLNGDGNVDLAVGMYGGNDDGDGGYEGAVFILFLDDDGTVLEYQKISNNTGGGPGTLVNYDYFGRSLDNIGDINGDGIPDLAIGAPGDSLGATYIGFLDYNGTLKDIIKISPTTGGFAATIDSLNPFGSMSGIGDINNDGIPDVAISSSNNDDGGTDRGALWICFMNVDGTIASEQKISDTLGGFTGTLADGDNFGGAIGIGDVDNDGINDIAVTAVNDDDGVTDGGAIWILYLNADGTVKSYDKLACDDSLLINEVESNDYFLSGLSYFGDRNNDGKLDFLAGAWNGNVPGYGGTTGEVYILHIEGLASYPNKKYHKTTPFLNALKKHSAATGEPLASELDASDYYGRSVAGIGDLDGDGINDIVVGSQLDDDGGTNTGSIYVQFLNTDGSIKSYQKISDTEGGFTGAIDANDYFGISICSLGDLDGDGNTDIVVGAHYDDDGGTDKGAIWILFLDTNGTVKSYQKISDTTGGFTGILDASDHFGYSLANIGDVNGDAIVDIAVGAANDDDGNSNAGAIWILNLNSNGTVNDYQKISAIEGGFTDTLKTNDLFGYSVTAIGDIDNDGNIDLAVGAINDDDFGVNAGAIYILFLTDTNTVKSSKKIISGSYGFDGLQVADDRFGSSLSGGYDLDLDGVNDLLVGGIYSNMGGSDRGVIWALFMNTDGTVRYQKNISASSNKMTGLIDNGDRLGISVAVIDYNIQNNTAKIGFGAYLDDAGATDAGAVYLLTLDLSALKDYSNNIFINTIPFSDNIPYQLDLEGVSSAFTTGELNTLLVTNSETTATAKISVAATANYGALELLFDITEVQISNVRIITDSLGGGDTLALDTNLYAISNDLHTLTLFQKDTNEVIADSLLFGFDLQGGLGFTPNDDGDYDVLTINGLANIYYFNLTIKDLENTTVFYTEDKTDFWDGNYMGTESLVSKGSYKYILNVNGETLEGQILLDY